MKMTDKMPRFMVGFVFVNFFTFVRLSMEGVGMRDEVIDRQRRFDSTSQRIDSTHKSQTI